MQQADHADQDRLGRLDRAPPLRGLLVPVLVVLRGVQDRDAEQARGVDVGVEGDRRLEGQGRRHEWVCWGKAEDAPEVASCVSFLLLAMLYVRGEGGRVDERTSVVFAVVADHEHHLPLEYVVIQDPA